MTLSIMHKSSSINLLLRVRPNGVCSPVSSCLYLTAMMDKVRNTRLPGSDAFLSSVTSPPTLLLKRPYGSGTATCVSCTQQHPRTCSTLCEDKCILPTENVSASFKGPSMMSTDLPLALALFFSKSLLRHSPARSKVSDLTDLTAFQPVLDDPQYATATGIDHVVDRVIFCSGQVFASLHEHRQKHNIEGAAIVRIEELHPFPRDHMQRTLDQYSEARDILWCQEEPYNSGAWYYMRDRLERILSRHEGQEPRKLRYAGRPSAAAVATGSKKVHAREEADLISEALRAS